MLVIQIFCGFLVATASSILAMPLEEPILAMGEVKGAMKSTQAIDKGKAKLVEFGEHDIDDLYPKREPLPKVEKKSLDPTESEYKPPAKTFADIPDSQLTLEQRRIKYGQSWALGGKATSWVWEHIIQPPFNLLKKTWNFLTTPIVKGDKAHPDEALEVLKKYGISVKKEPVKFNIGDPSTWIESQRPARIIVDTKVHELPNGEGSSKARPPLGYPV